MKYFLCFIQIFEAINSQFLDLRRLKAGEENERDAGAVLSPQLAVQSEAAQFVPFDSDPKKCQQKGQREKCHWPCPWQSPSEERQPLGRVVGVPSHRPVAAAFEGNAINHSLLAFGKTQ